MKHPETEIVGRINGISFLACWYHNPQAVLEGLTPGITVSWRKPTTPDRFATIADEIIRQQLESMPDDERLSPQEDGDAVIGDYYLLCEKGELQIDFVEGARVLHEGRLLQRFERGIAELKPLGDILSSRLQTLPLSMFASATDGFDDAISMLTVTSDWFERVVELSAVADWLRIHHPDINASDFRGLVPDVVRRSQGYFRKTEGAVGR